MTIYDCERGVHWYKSSWKDKRPDCGHTCEYKECKNCKAVVWQECKRCEYNAAVQKRFGITDTKTQRNQNQKPV